MASCTQVEPAIAAFIIVSTRPMIQSVIPMMAVVLLVDCKPLIPLTRPVIVTGRPMRGINQAKIPIIPSTKDVVALESAFTLETCGASVCWSGGIQHEIRYKKIQLTENNSVHRYACIPEDSNITCSVHPVALFSKELAGSSNPYASDV